MPRSGSGAYTLPAGNPVVAGTTIEANWANTTLNDVATELTGSLARSGAGGMNGPLRLDAGTSGVPALAFSAETTTGLYRAGTNDVRFAVATVDVQQWTASGTVITGTASVSSNVTVGGTLAVTGTTTLTGAATLTANPTLSAGTANGIVYLNASKVATSGTGLVFDGTNLGIGTASPTAKLHLYEPTAAATRIRVLANGGQQAALQLAGNGTTFGTTSFDVFQDGGNDAYVANRANASLQFWTNATERMRLDASGNLGIGTASPGAKLEVYGGASGTNTNMLVGNAATAFQIGVDAGNNCQVRTAQAVSIIFYTSATQRMQIDANGNIFGTAGTTSMTNGFFYIPGAAGIPSGTPTAVANRFPAYVDTTNNRLYIHNGTSWRYAALI